MMRSSSRGRQAVSYCCASAAALWADDRPGCWLAGSGTEDFYVQQGDFLFMEATAAAPTFTVSSSSGGTAYVNLFKVVGVSRDSLR
jgi:hypothetical protein